MNNNTTPNLSKSDNREIHGTKIMRGWTAYTYFNSIDGNSSYVHNNISYSLSSCKGDDNLVSATFSKDHKGFWLKVDTNAREIPEVVLRKFIEFVTARTGLSYINA